MNQTLDHKNFQCLSRLPSLGRGKTGFIIGLFFTVYVFRSYLGEKDIQFLDFDMDLLEGLSNDDVEIIEILDVEDSQIYKTTLLDFQKHGVPYLHPQYGPQLCLPLSFWRLSALKCGDE